MQALQELALVCSKAPSTVLQQLNQCTSLEARKKRVQFTTLFQLLADGWPMVEIESRQALYKLLEGLDMPSTHWYDTSGWVMAMYMYKQVMQETGRMIVDARFLVVTMDEVIAVDNNNFLSVHIYIVCDWVKDSSSRFLTTSGVYSHG